MLKTTTIIKQIVMIALLTFVFTGCGEDKPKDNLTASIVNNLDVNKLENSLTNALLNAGKETLAASVSLTSASLDTLLGLFDAINFFGSDDTEQAVEDDYSITSLIFDGIDYNVSDLWPDLGVQEALANIDLLPGDGNLTIGIKQAGADAVEKVASFVNVSGDFLSSLGL